MDSEFIEEPDYLHCVITGTYDMQQAIEVWANTIVKCRKTMQTRLLVDYRWMEGYPSGTERVIFTEESLDLHRQHLESGGEPIQVAFLGSPKVIGSFNPGLDIAKSRGFSATITASPEEAIAFLVDSDQSDRQEPADP